MYMYVSIQDTKMAILFILCLPDGAKLGLCIIYTCIHLHTGPPVLACIYIYIHVYVYAYVRVHVHVYVHVVVLCCPASVKGASIMFTCINRY